MRSIREPPETSSDSIEGLILRVLHDVGQTSSFVPPLDYTHVRNLRVGPM